MTPCHFLFLLLGKLNKNESRKNDRPIRKKGINIRTNWRKA